MSEQSLRVALVSIKSLVGEIQFNLDRQLMWLERAASKGAKFIGFPEFALTGWTYDPDQALELNAEPLRKLKDFARQHDVHIGTCLVEKRDGRMHNTCVLLGPRGRCGVMRKINLVGKEAPYYARGKEILVCEVAGVKMGVATCADASYYEMIRIPALRGAEVIFAPHANSLGKFGGHAPGWSKWRMENWPFYAKHCHVFIAGVNNAGLFEKALDGEEETKYCGGSMVIDPMGKILGKAPVKTKKESMLVTDLDLTALRQRRAQERGEGGFQTRIVYDSSVNRLIA